MKTNKWFLIRLGLIAVSAAAYAIQGPVSVHAEPPIDLSALVMGLFFGIIGLQFVLTIQFVNKKSAEVWKPPSWSENPFQFKQPIQFFHLGAWLFIASSLVCVIQTWFKSPKFIFDALMPLVIEGYKGT
jgi:tellurite resistance protein TehA-like permease